MDGRQRTVLVVAILASFVAFLDSSVVNVALPAIRHELGGGIALQQWVVDAYLVTLGAFILTAGSLSDLLGRRRVLLVGIIAFGVFSLACAAAPSGTALVAFRAGQGIAGALLVPSSLALIVSTFEGAAQATAIGRWTGLTGVAMLAGPIVGGALVDSFSWRWVFAINVLPIAITVVLALRIPRDERVTGARIDVAGAVLAALGLGGAVFGLIEQGRLGFASPAVWAPLAGGILLIAAFVARERTAKAPMLPLSLFAVRNVAVGNLTTAFVYAALSLAPLALTLYLQQTAGYSALAAGLAFIPLTLVMLVAAGRFGSLAGRLGPRWFMCGGPILAAGGVALLVSVHTPVVYASMLLPGVLVFALGLAATVAPLTSAILGSVHPEVSGIASAANNAVARVAGLVATAFLALAAGGTLDTGGLHRVVVVTAVLLVVGGVVSGLGIVNGARPERVAVPPGTSAPGTGTAGMSTPGAGAPGAGTRGTSTAG